MTKEGNAQNPPDYFLDKNAQNSGVFKMHKLVDTT